MAQDFCGTSPPTGCADAGMNSLIDERRAPCGRVAGFARRAPFHQSRFLSSATVIGMMRRLCLSYSAMRSVCVPPGKYA